VIVNIVLCCLVRSQPLARDPAKFRKNPLLGFAIVYANTSNMLVTLSLDQSFYNMNDFSVNLASVSQDPYTWPFASLISFVTLQRYGIYI
jgi:hypothetical protein